MGHEFLSLSALCLHMSRINHSCEPNAIKFKHGGGMRLVALRNIKPGEAVTVSYINDSSRMQPFELRKAHLSSWFPECACSRCTSDLDDVRCFRCSSKSGCVGLCTAIRSQQSISPCHECGFAWKDNETEAMKLEHEASVLAGFQQLEQAAPYLGGQPEVFVPKLLGLVEMAHEKLAPEHWVTAALCEYAHAYHAQIGKNKKAIELLGDWFLFWEFHFGFTPSLQEAWNYEKLGDLYSAREQHLEAVGAYLEGIRLMRQIVPQNNNNCKGIQRKLQASIRGKVVDTHQK